MTNNTYTAGQPNRFDDFYRQQVFTLMKNSLYNYRLRKAAISRHLRMQSPNRVLEVGCGVSPVGNRPVRTVFTDLSYEALATLRHFYPGGTYVVADGSRLPFKAGRFSHTICSEVLEHIPDDRKTLAELGRVTRPGGEVIVTIPHRRCYFSQDDHFVGHLRRYELKDMLRLMKAAGLRVGVIKKVLGPMEKPLMLTAVAIFRALTARTAGRPRQLPGYLLVILQIGFRLANTLLMGMVWLEARLLPVSFATVLMMVGRQVGSQNHIQSRL